MRPSFYSIVVAATLAACSASSDNASPMTENNTPPSPSGETVAQTAGLYTLSTKSLEGEAVELSQYDGKVSLVVNLASRCGYTPQYAGLQELQKQFGSQGFQVLGFPSNDFGKQEPGTPEEIREFCTSRYQVDFPMFEKVATKGSDQSPVYAKLAEMSGGDLPNWNFCKYLVGKDGQVIQFYKSSTAPDSEELRQAIERAIGS